MASLTNLLPPTPQTVPQSSRLLKPKTQTIPRNTSQYNHIHTPLVLAYYAVRFNSLVNDPLQTMIQDLIPVTLAQCAFCATCLPAAGTWGEGKAIIPGTGSGKGKTGAGTTRRKGLGVVKKDISSDSESWGSKAVVSSARCTPATIATANVPDAADNSVPHTDTDDTYNTFVHIVPGTGSTAVAIRAASADFTAFFARFRLSVHANLLHTWR